MTESEFKERTRDFGLRVIRLVSSLPKGDVEDVLGRQLLRSATSVGANYRAACRARSRADMVAKLAIVEEEADESVYWLELLVDAGAITRRRVNELIGEGNALVAMTVASRLTLRGEQNRKSKT
jgi:four helix bundle protein